MHVRATIAGVLLVSALFASGQVVAQMRGPLIGPPPSPAVLPPPPPAPPPPPKIEVPAMPKMDAPMAPPKANLQSGDTFSDRVFQCLEQGAPQGLSPRARAAYSRACAHR